MSFIDEYTKEIKNPDIGRIYTRYITGMNNYIEFIFVEGETDIKYYSIKFNHNLNETDYIKCGAKPNVFGIYNVFEKSNAIKDQKKSYHFIVDKDYDGFNKVKNLNPHNNISVTKYYSYESYAFLVKNITVILKELKLTKEEIECFIYILNDFFNKVRKYECYKALDIDLPKLDGYLIFNNETNLFEIDNKLQEKINNVKLSKKKKRFLKEKKEIISSLKDINK